MKDEDPRLVRLMIDYLYQLDYNDAPSAICEEEEAVEAAVPAPESPVAKTIGYFEGFRHQDDEAPMEESLVRSDEGFAIPEEPVDQVDWGFPPPTKSKKDKKKKKKKPQAIVPRLEDDGADLDTTRLTTNTMMYALADRFYIDDLKVLARTKFREAAKEDWNSKSFVHAAELVFESTPGSDKGLRDVVTGTLNQHRDLADYEEWQKLLDSGNGMAWALVQVLLERIRTAREEYGYDHI